MGAWGTSISGNDTAMDLRQEYSAAFYKYPVDEALEKIDSYVRANICDESDEEEFCNYYYSLAEFMWKKGILTDKVRDKAISMIDSGFGLEIWADSGDKVLKARKKTLSEFREKLLSPLPKKKAIKPNVNVERIFEDGDIIAVQLQTAGKKYTQNWAKPMSDEEFHSYDGKYVLMQLVRCRSSWESEIVPEVKDWWAEFRLFDVIYDTVPDEVDISKLKLARMPEGQFESMFYCASKMYYFKRRNYKLLGNSKDGLDAKLKNYNCISWDVNRDHYNPDSKIVSSIGNESCCEEFNDSQECLESIYYYANIYDRGLYHLSEEEKKTLFDSEAKEIRKNIDTALEAGGKLLSISHGRAIGIVTVCGKHVDNLYIQGRFQNHGFGTELLRYALSVAGEGAYVDVPEEKIAMIKTCHKAGLVMETSDKPGYIGFTKNKPEEA